MRGPLGNAKGFRFSTILSLKKAFLQVPANHFFQWTPYVLTLIIRLIRKAFEEKKQVAELV